MLSAAILGMKMMRAACWRMENARPAAPNVVYVNAQDGHKYAHPSEHGHTNTTTTIQTTTITTAETTTIVSGPNQYITEAVLSPDS